MVLLMREIVIWRSSNGWRNTSSTPRLNSGNSSKKSTPLCARLISPGCGKLPPPTIATWEIVWCGSRNGRWEINEDPRFNCPATECILVVSKLSPSERGGRMEGRRLAIIDLPLPGAPTIIKLCPPAAATSSALFTFSCPLTSAKSKSQFVCCW